MLRYLFLSTVIVVGLAIALTAWANRDLIRITIEGVHVRAPAKAGGSSGLPEQKSSALRGDAPWALSALPDCLTQTSESTGSFDYVLGHLPRRAVRVVPPATLVYGDCTLAIAGDEAYVRRGSDRLRIPPVVQFYRGPGILVLIRRAAHGSQLRIYEPARH